MPIETFLNRLHKVKSKGKNKWVALCPCHNEKTPSLAITDDNGVVLMHCFGCGANAVEVAGAIGVDLGELFPDGVTYEKQGRRYFPADQVLDALKVESTVLYLISKRMLEGEMSEELKNEIYKSMCRLWAAEDYLRR